MWCHLYVDFFFFFTKGYKWTCFQDRNRLTAFEIKLLVTRRKTRGHGGLGNGDWLGMCALPCRKWITNKDLLYNTGNCTQYSQYFQYGKRIWKRMHICGWLNHLAEHLKLTWNCKSTTLLYKIKKKKIWGLTVILDGLDLWLSIMAEKCKLLKCSTIEGWLNKHTSFWQNTIWTHYLLKLQIMKNV